MASIGESTQNLRLPKVEVADRGTVRLGSGCITPELPALRLPKVEVADRGTVRLGSGCITPELPALKRVSAEDR